MVFVPAITAEDDLLTFSSVVLAVVVPLRPL